MCPCVRSGLGFLSGQAHSQQTQMRESSTRRGHTHTHTHTHTSSLHKLSSGRGRPEVAVNLISAFSHPASSFLKDPPGAVGSFSAPGDQLNRPCRSGTDRSVLFFFCMFFCWGS